jgi:chromosome segregation ATPase
MELNQNTELLNNTLALNVALQTIKERCVHLQKRLYSLESENSKLRLNSLNNDKTNESRRDNSLIAELEDLRAKNAELTLQKTQLTDNLSMISTENKKLWKRLSSLTKQNVNDLEHAKEAEEEDIEETGTRLPVNLIRSKTFTQNSPHQLLREKMATNHVPPEQDDLENISLLNDCGFSATDKFTHEINENETCDIDSRACTEGLLNIKKELLKQNSDLKVALSTWRKLKSKSKNKLLS